MKTSILSTGLVALLAGSALATGNVDSLRINEVVHNPSGSDDAWEYIEIFGCPNTPLTGFALVVVNDENGAEIDEAFWFPTTGSKYQTNDDGYFVIWIADNDSGDVDDDADESDIYSVLPNSITRQNLFASGTDIADQTLRHEASYRELETTGDTAGKISNDGSNTFMLLRAITDYTVIEKDDAPPVDGMGNPSYPGIVVDEIAYSDSGGSEFTEDEANEFDYTPGFNPGCFLRVDDIRDGVVDSSCAVDGASEDYRDAYSNFFMGEVDSNPSAGIEGSAFDMDSSANFGAVNYVAGVSCSGATNVSGVELTPGAANDTVNGKGQITASGCPNKEERAADVNGDGVVNFFDIEAAISNGADYRQIITIMDAMGR